MRTLSVAALLALSSCTSMSCDYGPLAQTDALPKDLPVGLQLVSSTEVVGMLDQSVDDARVYYLNITAPPGYAKTRFVKDRVRIPAGTHFEVAGFRRPHSLVCRENESEA